jgi:L-fuconolactonase
MIRIDSHHHLWQYNARDYGWISEQMGVLRRDFTPDDFEAEARPCGMDYSIAVQASQTLHETRFLLQEARQHPFIKGVVGWVPLTEPNVELDLEHFARDEKLRGVRHVLQDEADDDYMLRDDFNPYERCGSSIWLTTF